MPYRPGDDVIVIEARIETQTQKAYLIYPTLGGEYWLPKSQVAHMSAPDGDGNIEFEVTKWWADKNNL
jgi:hypothetical protein